MGITEIRFLFHIFPGRHFAKMNLPPFWHRFYCRYIVFSFLFFIVLWLKVSNGKYKWHCGYSATTWMSYFLISCSWQVKDHKVMHRCHRKIWSQIGWRHLSLGLHNPKTPWKQWIKASHSWGTLRSVFWKKINGVCLFVCTRLSCVHTVETAEAHLKTTCRTDRHTVY